MQPIKMYAFADEASPQVDKQIIALQRNGLSGLEIRNVDGINISDISCDKAKEIKAKLDNAGLVTWSIGSPIGKIPVDDDFAPHLDKFKHTLEITHILEAENIRLFSFYINKDKSFDSYKNEVICRLGQFCEIAEQSGISLCHENEKGIYGDIPERCLELHKALPSLKGIFDPANFIQCGVDTAKAWQMLKSHIHYLHIKDAKASGMVVPAGNGVGNVKDIVAEYIAQGGTAFTIEPHLTIFAGLKSLEREGSTSGVSEFAYPDADTAFDVACNAFKNLLCSSVTPANL